MLSPDLIDEALDGDGEALAEIEAFAAAHPEAAAPVLADLLAADILWPPTLYRTLGDDAKRALIARLDAAEEEGRALRVLILAYARGAEVEAAFRRWMEHPPPGVTTAHVARSSAAAGWLLAREGVRELFGGTAFELVPDGPAEPVGDAACPWCTAPLWAALDVDTADPRAAEALAHTGWSGRLRITPCYVCSCVGTTYFAVSPDGTCTWSEHTRKPDWFTPRAPEVPETARLVVGPLRESPYDANAWSAGGSTLGGAPDWIQDPTFFPCPACTLPMDYVGLAMAADLAEHGDGATYFFLHTDCGLAAVEFQQS